MRVGVLRTQVPFVTGGAERHAAELVAALRNHGHDAVDITIPFKWYPAEILADHILAAKLIDLSEVEAVPVDLMIGTKFPAYLAHHPNKVFWLLHQHRQAYDLWDAGQSNLLDDPGGAALRSVIHEEDCAAFAGSPKPIYTLSQNVAGRLDRYLGLQSTPLYHPPPNAGLFQPGPYGDYLFVPGRINPSKRLELILNALAQARQGARLVIAGTAENPAYQDQLMTLSRALGIDARVTWLGRVPEDDLRRHYAEARAIVFTPQDEDYGYVALEAMLAAKPVVTVTDAGGPLEFVRDGQEALICSPDPAALAQAFDILLSDAGQAERLGQAALARYHALDVSWSHVVETLTGEPAHRAEADPVPDTATAPATPPIMAALAAVPPDTAVAQLEAAVAPPAPPTLPFSGVEDVLTAYAFEELPDRLGLSKPPLDQSMVSYFGTHWTRFLTTLQVLEGIDVSRLLDVGVFPPLVFQALMKSQHPDMQMAGLWEGPNVYQQKTRALRDDVQDFDITLSPANSERDPWPYEAGAFDLVTAMEILEHLALDPYFFFCEANRVLQDGGHLLITTPNVVSHRGVSKALNGFAPYSFGVFVPSGGVYGRHNREWAPPEIAQVGEAAGFETVRLATYDVYDLPVDPVVAQLLVARGDNLQLRGENTVYLARKTGAPKGAGGLFYHGDPARMFGAFRHVSTEAETGLCSIEVCNTSPLWWATEGQGATQVMAEWIDPQDVLRHQALIQPILAPIAPQGVETIKLRLDAASDPDPRGTLRLHLFQTGVGAMTGTGRAPSLDMPASEAAFMRLVRTFGSLAET